MTAPETPPATGTETETETGTGTKTGTGTGTGIGTETGTGIGTETGTGAAPRTAAETATASAQAMWAGDRACQHLGIRIECVAPGTAVLRMTVAETMANGHGMCHGGYIFTLADSAFAYACNSHGDRVVAQAAQIAFLAPARVGDVLTATASELHRAGRSGLYDIRVTRADGAAIAEFRGQSRTIPGSHLGSE